MYREDAPPNVATFLIELMRNVTSTKFVDIKFKGRKGVESMTIQRYNASSIVINGMWKRREEGRKKKRGRTREEVPKGGIKARTDHRISEHFDTRKGTCTSRIHHPSNCLVSCSTRT